MCKYKNRSLLPSDNYPIRSLEISNFSGFIGVDWMLIYEDHFPVKSTDDLGTVV